jgi:triacylglycerol lipase
VQLWAKHGVPAYSYRFNVIVNGLDASIGVPHFQEVAFVFVSYNPSWSFAKFINH